MPYSGRRGLLGAKETLRPNLVQDQRWKSAKKILSEVRNERYFGLPELFWKTKSIARQACWSHCTVTLSKFCPNWCIFGVKLWSKISICVNFFCGRWPTGCRKINSLIICLFYLFVCLLFLFGVLLNLFAASLFGRWAV